ncbi:SDR family NAD(P)-dependent oxidoreductase [Amycolatopsis thermoflava]|uniref:SDR family NAD(P)-dependent oxidoreductase n=1 Tax=Amycolatopsis thermoflava TaxID=84480 RepID=UPI0038203EC4
MGAEGERMLDGRVVIVTGGGRGIGRSHCLELAGHGAIVVVNDLGVGVGGESSAEDPAQEVVARIEELGGKAIADAGSVTDWDGVRGLVERTVEQFGRLDAIVNNAGILRDKTITSLTEQDWDLVIDVHLKGTFALTKHACDYWRGEYKRGRPVAGRIVNTTSGTGLAGNVGQANYGAAKAGIANLTLTTAMEGSRYGVTANCVSPVAATRMTRTVGISAAEGGWDPLDPANSSPVVAWLCSERSGWLTGRILRVDGNTVHPVAPWSVLPGHTAASGERLDATELDTGLRVALGTFPAGIPGLRG